MQEWNEPARILFNVDEALVEVEGTSSAGYGWDC
jgi:hypothetical protein